MEGNVLDIADRPTSSSNTTADQLKKEQEKWDAWKSNEGMSRTEAKRRYIEKLIEAMHRYASTTPEARELVEELEFVWDQIKNNSQHSSSEHSSPLQHIERRDYLHNSAADNGNGVTASTAALEKTGKGRVKPMQLLSPMSQADEDDAAEDEREEFVDAPVSQYDISSPAENGVSEDPFLSSSKPRTPPADTRWRKRIESTLMKLTTEVAALREQLESRRFIDQRWRKSFLGWSVRILWWAFSFVVADAVVLWIIILYMRRKDDRRLEGAIRVLLGDAVAQVQSLGRDVKMPQMPTLPRKMQRKALKQR